MYPSHIAAPQYRSAVQFALLIALTACGSDSSGATAPAPAPAPSQSPVPVPTPAPPASAGVVSGRVTDTQGRPIAGATIVVNNALWFNRNIVLKSGADGSYRFELPPSDAWYVRGTADVVFNNRTYSVELRPDFAGSFAGKDGHVVNLQWVMTGEVPKDFGHDGYYGGSVEVDAGWDIYDLDGVTLTLTPVGPLLDGSTGAEITRTVVGTRGSFVMRDVPMGRYTIRATLRGVPLKLLMRFTPDYVSTATVDFEPAYSGATVYGIYFAVATAGIAE
jgi:Carboxypeptidase regulatory-like domain